MVLMAGRHNRSSTTTLELPRTGQDAEEDRSSRINQWQHACPGSLQGEGDRYRTRKTGKQNSRARSRVRLSASRCQASPVQRGDIEEDGTVEDIPWHRNDWPTGLELPKSGYGFLAPLPLLSMAWTLAVLYLLPRGKKWRGKSILAGSRAQARLATDVMPRQGST